MFEGYLELGGGEVLNSARAVGYANTAPCPVTWLQCPPCDGIRDVLGDDAYTYANIIDAPWYDAEEESTHRFLGAHALTIEGLPDSTRDADVSEAILDGGVVGHVRRKTRRMRVRAVLSAQGEDALETGFNWLSSALSPGKCSTHADACGAADMQVFTACPPERSEITMPEVFWNDPITNLATNPSMETAGAAVAVRTNLATNPSFEQATAATVEVRRNLAPRPYPDGAAGGGGNGGWNSNQTAAYAHSIDATFVHTPGVSSMKATRTTTTPSNSIMSVYALGMTTWTNAGGTPVTPGQSYTLSAWFAASVANCLATLNISWWDAGGVQIGTTVQAFEASPATHPANSWWRYQMTAVAPTGAVAARFGGGVNLPVGQTSAGTEFSWMTEALVENTAATTPGAWFAGNTLPAGDFTHAWTGTANGSASVQYGTQVPTASNGPTASVASSEWASSGAKSLRLVVTAASAGSSDTNVDITVPGLVVGKTYTAMMKSRLAAPQTGGLSPNARKLTVRFYGGTPTGDSSDVGAPNVAGVTEHRVTFTVPAGTTGTAIRPYNGASFGNGDVWWDDLLVVEGTYTGPYFDGTTKWLRRNASNNPKLEVNQSGWTVSGGSSTRDPVTDLPGFEWALRQSGSAAPDTRRWYAGVNGLTIGRSYTASMWVKVSGTTGGTWEYRVASSNAFTTTTVAATPITADPDPTSAVWRRYTLTFVATATGMFVGAYKVGAGTGAYEVRLTGHLLEESVAVAGDYFDGGTTTGGLVYAWEGAAGNSPSTAIDPDFTYAWTGTANASTSQQKALGVAGVGETYMAQVAQSTQWASNRAHSMRIIPIGGLDAPWSYTSFAFTGLEAGRTYTAIAKIRLTAAQVGPLDGRARKIVAISPGMTTVESNAAPNAAGVTELRITFTLAADPTVVVYLYNGASAAGGDVWYDDFALVAGDYSGPYFDGASPDSTPADLETVGKSVAEYGWTGTADASTSTYRTGSVVAVEDPVAYEAAIEKLVRNLHTVTCVSGPIVEQKLHRGDTWGYIVEFVLVAAVPWMFGVTKPVALTPSLPIVVQDVPFNLVPYPSAELESGTVVAATNLSTNPSVETAITGWVAIKSVVTGESIARSTELASAGSASAKAVLTATNAGTGGFVGVAQDVALPGITPTTRYSVNLWATASAQSGTAVLTTLDYVIRWQDAGGATLRDDLLASTPPAGGPVSVKSILPPAGTVKAQVRAYIRLASWSVNDVVRLYADALAVTVP